MHSAKIYFLPVKIRTATIGIVIADDGSYWWEVCIEGKPLAWCETWQDAEDLIK